MLIITKIDAKQDQIFTTKNLAAMAMGSPALHGETPVVIRQDLPVPHVLFCTHGNTSFVHSKLNQKLEDLEVI